MAKEQGLFYPDGDFRSEGEIRRQMALDGRLPQMEFNTPVKFPKDADDYLARASNHAKQMRELAPQSENNFVEVTLPRTSIINFWGDLHAFHEMTDHDRIRQELEVMRYTGDSYVVMGADLVDGIFWGGESGGEQVMSLTQQQTAMRAIFNALRGKVMLGVSGEHDSKWAAKTGGDPYAEFSERSHAPYVRGIGEVLIHCGKQDYRMVVQHKPKGFSMYNKNHGTFRQARFGLQDADIYANFHTHQKQIAQETIRKFGKSTIVTHISGGAYKAGDGYGDRSGYVQMTPQEMYGCSIRIHADRKLVEVSYDILEAHRRWAK